MREIVKTFNLNEFAAWRWFQYHIVQAFRSTQFLTLLCPRQHGKTAFGIEALMDFIFRYDKRLNPLAVVTMTSADQVYDVWFTRLDQKLAPLKNIIYTSHGSRGNALIMTIHRTWLSKPDYLTIEFHGSGNPKALKGRTADFILADELAFCQKTFWTQVLKPMLDDTNGKALLISTINGHNWFSELCDGHAAMNNNYAKHIEFNPITARLRSNEWIIKTEAYARQTNSWQDYLREYWHDRTAASFEEAPFSFYCSQLNSRGQFVHFNEFLESNVINITVDLGKRGNNACWYWLYGQDQKPFIIDYKDDHYNNYEMIDEAVKRFEGKCINIIYPQDANQSAVLDGETQLVMLQRFVDGRGYGRLVNLNTLPKTQNKKALIEFGVDLLSRAKFLKNSRNIMKGLQKLSASVHPKNKDGIINPKDFDKNNMQHAADSWCYIWAAISNSLHNDLNHEQRIYIDQIDNFTAVPNLGTTYTGVEIK